MSNADQDPDRYVGYDGDMWMGTMFISLKRECPRCGYVGMNAHFEKVSDMPVEIGSVFVVDELSCADPLGRCKYLQQAE